MAYILEPPLPDKTFRKNWARLIQKIYEVDPLACPACRGEMRVIAFTEDQEVIRKILTGLKLWLIKAQPRPVAHAPRFWPLHPSTTGRRPAPRII
jgi:hypothetical protein